MERVMLRHRQRRAILVRRLTLVHEYNVLHIERLDLHAQLATLRTSWMADPLSSAERRTLVAELKALSDRLRAVSLRSQGILLEHYTLVRELAGA
jgi:hypothetical protein